jgi:GntR family transcriptional regulator
MDAVRWSAVASGQRVPGVGANSGLVPERSEVIAKRAVGLRLTMGKQPLYKRIKAEITRSLVKGEWPPGAKLPSEPGLASRYRVGISTIRAAVRELELANVLVRAQGKGTFVTHFDQREGIHRFLNIVRSDGVAEAPYRRLVAFERTDAPSAVAEALQLTRAGRDGQVYKLSTLVSLSGKPIYSSNVFLPVGRFPGLRKLHVPDGSRSLYSIYQQKFNVNVIKVVDSITATPAAANVAKLTGLDVGAPVLCLNRVAYTYDGLPIEVRHNWINTAKHCYRIEQGDDG